MSPAPENLVLLHGFSGTRHAWDEVIARLDRKRYRPLAFDLPGHGDAADVGGPITFEKCVDAVLAQAPERFALCGYSMGGRIALHVALSAPERVARLVLVSSSPGIEDDGERAARRAADRALADELERAPFEDFIERWRTQPLFAGNPPAVRELASELMRCNEPRALAAALRGVGTGEMESLWPRLGELAMPVLVVVGERDERYRALGARVVGLIGDAELTVVPGGHGLVVESPAELASVLGVMRSDADIDDSTKPITEANTK
ncbi:MAG TPA: alpha/beta fold hydrolase [Solirubrobacteraceae bacterium]|nr:alpha/beta fold hydrolase [Solirubrobacteraceae bacterium]